jgi:tryptophanyl-tRNA synthetase
MSKSLGNTIGILDEPDQIWERIRPAKTDPARVRRTDPGTPEICNMYTLHQHFSPSHVVQEVAEKCRTAGWGCVECKRVLTDNISEAFAPMRQRAKEMAEAPERVGEILAEGAEKARAVARETMAGVRAHMGLLPLAVREPAER